MIRAIVLLSLTLAGSSTCLFSQVVYVANTTSGDISAFSVDAGRSAVWFRLSCDYRYETLSARITELQSSCKNVKS